MTSPPPVEVTPIPGGVAVRLPRRFSLFVRFRATFRRASALPELWMWMVPGARAARRVERWWSAEATKVEAENRQAAWSRSETEWSETERRAA